MSGTESGRCLVRNGAGTEELPSCVRRSQLSEDSVDAACLSSGMLTAGGNTEFSEQLCIC